MDQVNELVNELQNILEKITEPEKNTDLPEIKNSNKLPKQNTYKKYVSKNDQDLVKTCLKDIEHIINKVYVKSSKPISTNNDSNSKKEERYPPQAAYMQEDNNSNIKVNNNNQNHLNKELCRSYPEDRLESMQEDLIDLMKKLEMIEKNPKMSNNDKLKMDIRHFKDNYNYSNHNVSNVNNINSKARVNTSIPRKYSVSCHENKNKNEYNKSTIKMETVDKLREATEYIEYMLSDTKNKNQYNYKRDSYMNQIDCDSSLSNSRSRNSRSIDNNSKLNNNSIKERENNKLTSLNNTALYNMNSAIMSLNQFVQKLTHDISENKDNNNNKKEEKKNKDHPSNNSVTKKKTKITLSCCGHELISF